MKPNHDSQEDNPATSELTLTQKMIYVQVANIFIPSFVGLLLVDIKLHGLNRMSRTKEVAAFVSDRIWDAVCSYLAGFEKEGLNQPATRACLYATVMASVMNSTMFGISTAMGIASHPARVRPDGERVPVQPPHTNN